MKRKLLCIFFMLAGAASLAGTILLSLVRSERADASPVTTLIFISVATIIAAARYINREPDWPEPDQPEASVRQKAFLWSIRAVDILSILVCFAFVVMLLLITGYYIDCIRAVFFLIALPAAGIIVAALGLKEHLPIIGRDIAKAAVALVIAVALGFIYLNYMPKYTIDDGVNMLRANVEFAQKDVFYPNTMFYGNGRIPRWGDDNYDESFGSNPFYDELYQYSCDSFSYDSSGLHAMKGYITYNPATGAYIYNRSDNQDQTYSPGEWPEFSYYFMYDKDGQRGAVLNLYFREWYPIPEKEVIGGNPMLSVASGEWDAKIKDVLYPHNFPEDEARAFLLSMGKETLKVKLLEKINDLSLVVVFDKKDDNTTGLAIVGTEGKTVEVYFFGIDIATYKNGEIILKI